MCVLLPAYWYPHNYLNNDTKTKFVNDDDDDDDDNDTKKKKKTLTTQQHTVQQILNSNI